MLKVVTFAALPLVLAGAAQAFPDPIQASQARIVLADNSPTSTSTSTQTPAAGDPSKKPDSVAYPNSPNGSPAASDKGAPVVTDKAACAGGAAATATCPDSPQPSNKADTSDVKITTPTTVDGTAPKQ